MIPELGNFALTLAGVLALGAAGIGLAAPREALMQRAAMSMVLGQWAFSFLAFAALTYTFVLDDFSVCLLYTSPSPRDLSTSRMPSSA